MLPCFTIFNEMIKNFEPRLYQQTILNTCVSKNTLVVLPTGLGKTNIFLMLAAHRLSQYPSSKILFIGPTKPLIDQYIEVFRSNFEINEESMAVFTGQVSPEKRAQLWQTSKIVFSTPQGLENDIISRRINLEEVSLLGVDEAHRAVGNYAYVFVAKQYMKLARYPRLIALTASPGSDMEKIQEVCNNLFIEGIEVRTHNDPDVKPYVQEIDIKWVKVDLPSLFLNAQRYLNDFLIERLEKLKKWGILRRTEVRYVNKTELIELQGQLRGRLATGEKDFVILNAISVLAELMKIYHAAELLGTQGIVPLYKYLEKLKLEARTTKTKAIRSIMADVNFKSAVANIQNLYDNKVEHPKLIELQKIVEKEFLGNNQIKIIIFNQYRDNALEIKNKLNAIKNINANVFVGQQKKGETGLSQKEQKKMLDDFRQGLFNVLIATSIGEEGLDVPKVDIVIFYEPVPSAIRQIQRRGRTGRQEKGRVIILVTRNTRDESYRWVAHHKEKRMYRNLENIRKKLAFAKFDSALYGKEHEKEKNSLGSQLTKSAEQGDINIYVDYREKGSNIIKDLADKNVVLKLQKLETADYVLSSRVGVEIKTVEDFIESIIDGRLLQQVKGLKQNFERPLIIIEGEQDIYSIRNLHANSIRGMLVTITISYGIPIIQTKNFKETSALLYIIAKNEQIETGNNFNMHADRKPLTLKEQQEYVTSSLPGVGAALAKPLLKNFGCIKNVINATLYELQEVDKIGPLKAKQIKDVVDSEYKDEGY